MTLMAHMIRKTMEPTLQQIEDYRNYLHKLHTFQTLKESIEEGKTRILKIYPEIKNYAMSSEDPICSKMRNELEKNGFVIYESINDKLDDEDILKYIEVLNIDTSNIQMIEGETDSEYNDEGGYYNTINTITLYMTDGTITQLGWDYAEEIIIDLHDFADVFYENGLMDFRKIKKPFELQVVS